VTSLKCDQLNFISFCNPATLTALHLSDNEHTLGDLTQCLRKCPNVRDLTLDLMQPKKLNVLALIRFVEKALHIENLQLAVAYSFSPCELLNLTRHKIFRQHLRRLHLVEIRDEDVQSYKSCIWKLRELRSLTLCSVNWQELWFELFRELWHLYRFVTRSSVPVALPQFSVSCNFKTYCVRRIFEEFFLRRIFFYAHRNIVNAFKF